MLILAIPEATGLFFAADVCRDSPVPISATGVHDTLCGACLRCRMELLERAVGPVDQQVPGWHGQGRAAAPDKVMAEDHACREACEHLLGTLWWSGRLPASLPPAEALLAASTALETWRFAGPVPPALVALTAEEFPPTIVAVASERTGYDVCFGLASRATWAGATRAALLEALQMRMGLHILRYQVANGKPPDARATRILRRAGGMHLGELAELLTASGDAEPAALPVDRHLETENLQGTWHARCRIVLRGVPGPERPRPWSRWRLWS